MDDEELVVLRAETQHAEAENETERAAGDERPVAVRVEERAAETGESEGEECLYSAKSVEHCGDELVGWTDEMIHAISLLRFVSHSLSIRET